MEVSHITLKRMANDMDCSDTELGLSILADNNLV